MDICCGWEIHADTVSDLSAALFPLVRYNSTTPDTQDQFPVKYTVRYKTTGQVHCLICTRDPKPATVGFLRPGQTENLVTNVATTAQKDDRCRTTNF